MSGRRQAGFISILPRSGLRFSSRAEIGLTPVLSMFKWLADTGSRRTAWFFLAVRNSNDVALRDEINEVANRNKQQFHTITLFSDPTDKCIEGTDFDCRGFLSVDVLKRYLGTSNYEFYICGPPPMMEATVKALAGWGCRRPIYTLKRSAPDR